MAHDVFISYTTRDKAIADAVCHALEERHIRCWIAPRDVPAGLSWKAAIVGAIRHSQVMVLIFSGEVNSSKDVRREVDIAFEERRPIIPFRIENVAPSDELYYCIADRHWLDALTPPVEQHIGGLVSALRRFIAEPEPPPAPVIDPEPAVELALEPLEDLADLEELEPVTAADPLTVLTPVPELAPVLESERAPEPEQRSPGTPLMGAMTPGRIAIAAVALVSVIALGVWAGSAPEATEPPKTGVDFYDAGRFAEAMPLLTKEADAGSVDAQARLAEMYLDGRGAEKDLTLGLSFLTRAASGGNAGAESRLATLYEQGTGVSRDLREAMRWHTSAANHGNVPSQCAAALLTVNGEGGVRRDYDVAAKWYGAAAKTGAVCGQLGYGYLHYNGYGVAKNYDEALRLWELAEAQGDKTAKDNIAAAQSGWVLPPVFPDAWTPVLGGERRAEIARVKASPFGAGFKSAIFQRMRKLPVDFYSGGAIFEVEIVSGANEPRVLSYVRVGDTLVRMYGQRDQLNALNANLPILLDTQPRALQAARFLISANQQYDSPYRLVEQMSPTEVHGSQSEGWLVTAIEYLAGSAWRTRFTLTPGGQLTAVHQEPVTVTVPVAMEQIDDAGLRRAR